MAPELCGARSGELNMFACSGEGFICYAGIVTYSGDKEGRCVPVLARELLAKVAQQRATATRRTTTGLRSDTRLKRKKRQ
jgi:hypothetical protein